MIIAQPLPPPDREAILCHLRWLSDPVREHSPDLRIELAWGTPGAEARVARRRSGSIK